ncbi:hypothetical protein SAMN05421839_1215 [Halolactibacillus halophilus]|uniref:Uncharacterized protein n=1 Tax=Halolactibacillus halophilus TaxID=306540 RepID=A0A1I5QED3_9BACI|nr:hypothetical protein [Halolactibacillus halophilus]GEM02094.1 hypothetical protein HHA03_16260 [Halolactibacillus halophilus]SFP44613.1 hypothetical protein SAMN05421839_1215 [Halolactibacillus halophilus]
MSESIKLTLADIQTIKTEMNEAIKLVKYYASQYKGKEHYEHLGGSCVMSATNTVNTIIGSAQYLDGGFLMPDEIHVERLVDWYISNKTFDGDRDVLTFYFASYIKRKINDLYRSIDNDTLATTLTLIGNKEARKEFKNQCRKRKRLQVKIIRQ